MKQYYNKIGKVLHKERSENRTAFISMTLSADTDDILN